MKKETALQQRIMLAMSKLGYRVFRNNVAKAWIGKSFKLRGGVVYPMKGAGPIPVPEGSVLVIGPRILHAGLVKGSSDLIGWRTIEVTSDMVGKKIAVFTAAEIKTKDGRLRPEQKTFQAQVAFAGGCAYIVRSEESLRESHNRSIGV